MGERVNRPVVKATRERGKPLLRHSKSDKPHRSRPDDAETTIGTAEQNGFTVLNADLALALQRRAAAGQIYGEEQLLTRALLLWARFLTQSRKRAAEHADTGQELFGDVDVRHPAG